jgi:hypothetical protein
LEVDRLVEEGLSLEAAEAAARRTFGNTTLARERFYESWRVMWVDDLRRDIDYARRHLAANPVFTLTAILTLTRGIAATTTTFSVIDAVLLRPLPYRGIDRLVRNSQEVTTDGPTGSAVIPVGLSKAEVDLLREASFSLSHVGSYLPAVMTLTGAGEPARVHGMQVSPDVMAMLGVPAARGRIFTLREDSPADHVVLLSDRMWHRQFSSASSILGAPIVLDGTSDTVIGIMPPDFAFPDSGTSFWIPLAWPAPGARLVGTARVRDGFSLPTATGEISELLYRYRRDNAMPAPPPPPPPPKDPAELAKMLEAFAHQRPAPLDPANRRRAALIPALSLTQSAEGDHQRDAGAASSEWRFGGRRRTQAFLVATQVAIATMLSIAGLLLVRSYDRLSHVELGYEPDGVLTFQVVTPPGQIRGPLRDDLIARLRALPGVRAASVADLLPTEGTAGTIALCTSANVSLGPPPPPRPGGTMRPEFPAFCIVGQDYFEAMGIRVIEGRGFGRGDRAGAPRVMVIGRALERTGYLGANPIGRLVYAMGPEPWRVIGIVDDVRQFGPEQTAGPQVYVPMEQTASASSGPPGAPAPSRALATLPSFVVRTTGSPARLAPLVRGIVREVDSAAAIDNVQTMSQLVSSTVARPRVYAVILGAFAAVAALLAIVGVYGLTAYAVRHRTRELGIRMALGADTRSVLSLILRQGLVLISMGVTLGTVAAVLASGTLRAMLFGLTPLDPVSYGVAAIGFTAVALLGCYIPARGATDVDPLLALRHE